MSDTRLPHYLQWLLEDLPESPDKTEWREILLEIHREVGSTFEPHFEMEAQDMYFPIEPVQTLCKRLLDVLRTRSCSDRIIVLKIILYYTRYLHACTPRFSESEYLPLWNARGNYLDVAAFRGIRSVYENSPDGFNFEKEAWLALKAGDFNFLSVLVKNGFCQGPMISEESSHSDDFTEVWWLIERRARSTEGLADYLNARDTWLDLRRHGHMRDGNSRGYRRIPLIIVAVKTVALLPECREPYLKCLRMCFGAIPDPFVTSEEVRSFLLYFMKEDVHRPIVDSLVEEYKQLFGEQLYRPRSLTHLCRCKVRDVLAAQGSRSVLLPKLVEDMCIPEDLKQFILCATEYP